MPKISALPPLSSLDGDDEAPVVDDSTTTTKKITLTALKAWLDAFLNATDFLPYDYVISGCVWSGDAYASTRNASMTAGVVWVNGVRVVLSAVTARSFTASRDTYIDVGSDGVIDYTEVTNNAASPALASGHIRLGIIVTGASNIAAAGSVNQGQENKVLPISSSIPYQVTDSLGNLICNRDPAKKIIGMRRRLSAFSTSSTSFVDMTELTIPFIVDKERKINMSLNGPAININGSNGNIWNIGLDIDGTMIQQWYRNQDVSAYNVPLSVEFTKTLAAGSHTLKFRLLASGGTASATGGNDNPGTGQFTAGPLTAKIEMR